MGNRYKMILSNRNFNKEVELPPQAAELRIGTESGCEIRLNQSSFFEPFMLRLSQRMGIWHIDCPESMYFSTDNVRKLFTKEMRHGDRLALKYQSTQTEAMELLFTVDFDYEQKNYERIIDLSAHHTMTIGGAINNSIVLSGEYVRDDRIELRRTATGLEMSVQYSQYGVYLNGIRCMGSTVLREHDFISIANYSFYYAQDKLFTSKYNAIVLNGPAYKDVKQQKSAFVYPKFNRNTRITTEIPAEPIPILDPPTKPEKQKSNIMLTLLPSVGALLLTVLLRGTLMSGSSGNSFIIFSACTMSLGILTSIITFITTGHDFRKSSKNRVKKYLEYIEKKEGEIIALRGEELSLLNKMYLDMEEDIRLVKDFSGDLFNRRPEDEDFLHIYLGKGALPSHRQIDYKKQERFETDDELLPLPGKLAEKYKYVFDAPIVSKFADGNAVGVVGSQKDLYEMLKNMTLDICVRHYYKDVKLFYIINESQIDHFRWLRLLPHILNDSRAWRNIAFDDGSKTTIFEYLYNNLVIREKGKICSPHWVVFIFDEFGFKTHPVSKFVEKAKQLGVTFVFFERRQEMIAQHCHELITLQGEGHARLLSSADVNHELPFAFNHVEDGTMAAVAQKLAPVYCDEVSLESALTKNISLFELLGIYSAEDLDIAARWGSSQVYKSMAAPLGVKTKNEVVYLNLHEKAHGPHGLVAGTTGSGKSEILQSYILSVATLFHPYEVSFVIIDFKGGGMVNQFKDLPHLNGAITDLDGHEINRSLLSIKAELDKRKAAFSESGVNHIDKYIEKFKRGEVKIPLPHLILIVDEFAELKQDQPEFMNELVSTARVGRSLGVHLILATQKPSGVVSEQIWSNSKFKLCLKVADPSDSTQVIKSPLAFEIKEPGRAYLQVGNNEIFELFQSAYSGAPAEAVDATDQRQYTISEVSVGGDRKTIFHKKRKKSDRRVDTQLETVVRHIQKYCAERKIPQLPGICLPSLVTVIHYDYAQHQKHPTECIIPIGTYDDPTRQYQGPTYVNLSQDNIFVVGSSLSGKTNLLQTMIRGLSEIYTPREVNIYILDFASKILRNFSDLHHVGGVVTDGDLEQLKVFMRMISSEILMRKNELSRLKLSSFISYREAGYTDLPQIVIFIDNFAVLKEFAPEFEEELIGFTREGVSVGISIVITNLQTSGFSYRYLANFSKRIAFYCNDSGQYGSLFDRCKMYPRNISGRAITEMDMTLFEFQAYLSFEGEIEKERVDAMEQYIGIKNALYPDMHAKAIPVIPKHLDMQFIHREYGGRLTTDYEIPIALNYGSVELVKLNLLKATALAVLGREKSGRTNLIRVILDYLEAHRDTMPTKAYLIDDFGGQLKPFEQYSIVEQYSIIAGDFATLIQDLSAEMSRRYDAVVSGGAAALDDMPLLLVVVQNNDAVSDASSNKKIMELYKSMTGKFKVLKIMFIYSNLENGPVPYSSPDILKELKATPNAIFFDNLKNIKMFDHISMQTINAHKAPIQLGDAFMIHESEVIKVKTVCSS